MEEYLDQEQFMQELRYAVMLSGSQKELANAAGITPQYLSDILSGKRAPARALVKYLGFQKMTVYFAINEKPRKDETK